jgi:hypothetical protein
VRRVISIALVIALAIVFLNDIGRWVNSQSRINEKTARLAEWAAAEVKSSDRNAGARMVMEQASKDGLTVTGYDQNDYTIKIWTATDVPGTIVLGPYTGLLRAVPIDQALAHPFVVKSYQEASRQ